MRYLLEIPARINVLGNPSDSTEGDFATISAAVNLYAKAEVSESEELLLEQKIRRGGELATTAQETYPSEVIPLPYNGTLDLIKGGINRLFQYSGEFREKVATRGAHIATWTEVPRQSGLGGSSLFVLLTLAGLRAFYQLDPQQHNDYVLAELTQRVEAKELGITCGYADRYAPLFGGLAYIDYRGKLDQKKLHEEPYATYERLTLPGDEFPLVAISSGVRRDSGDVHGKMRPIYLQEHRQWIVQGGEAPPMIRWMQTAWETAWKGKIALLAGDWKTFGELMNANHRAVDEMMAYCGFSEGAGGANNLLIRAALENGALGAKLTGAGGGGSVFALTYPGEKERVIQTWQGAAEKAGLTRAEIYRPRLDFRGLRVQGPGEES